MSKSSYQKRYSLNLEQLENRQLMAGDVTAFVNNGNLLIREASGQIDQENAIEIRLLSNGLVRVTGTTHLTENVRTKVNGQSFQDFLVRGDLDIKLAGGSDAVRFAPGTSQLLVPRFTNISIDVAKPASSTKLDADLVAVQNVIVSGKVMINTGADNDTVTLIEGINSPTNIGNNLSINTGSGADNVQINRNPANAIGGKVEVATFSDATEKESDIVKINNTKANLSILVQTGAGADDVSITRSQARSISLDTGADNDKGVMDSVQASDSLFAAMGSGNDSLSLLNIHPTTHMIAIIDGGAGIDSLRVSNVDNLQSQFSLNFWERLNGRLLDDLIVVEQLPTKI